MWISGVKCTKTPHSSFPCTHTHTHMQSSPVKYWFGIAHDVFSNTEREKDISTISPS